MRKTGSILLIAFIFMLGGLISTRAGIINGVDVTIKEIEPFAYCSLRYQGESSDMSEIINQLMSIMQSQNINPEGDLIALYFTSPEEDNPATADWEIGFPVSSYVTVISEPLQKKEWNHTLVASLVHTGPYENTGDTINEIFEWMEANNYTLTGPILGRFLDMPSSENQMQDLRTEIWVPCKKN